MALASDGLLYVSVAGGKILRMKPDGSQQEDFVNTGGRVLGFDFDSEGNLIAADAMKGLLSLTIKERSPLVDHTDTTLPIFYADAVVVAPDGLIFFHRCFHALCPGRIGAVHRGEYSRYY